LAKKKKSDTEVEKIKHRVKEMVKERPSHKEILGFIKKVMIEHVYVAGNCLSLRDQSQTREQRVLSWPHGILCGTAPAQASR
jgi:hypothetical protein